MFGEHLPPRGRRLLEAFQLAGVETAFGDHYAMGYADQLEIGEHYPGANVAIIQQYLEAGLAQLVVDLLCRLLLAQGGYQLRLGGGDFRLDAWLRFAGEQDRLSSRDVRDIRIDPNGTSGWGILGARGSWDVPGGWQFTLGVDNVFDKRYRVHGSGLDATGRNLMVSVRKTW